MGQGQLLRSPQRGKASHASLGVPAPRPFGLTPLGVETPVNLALFAPTRRKAPYMDSETLRHLIRQKLGDGRLPNNSIPRVWGGAGAGESCDACEEIITKVQFIMEGVSTSEGAPAIQMHVGCFKIWDEERVVPGR